MLLSVYELAESVEKHQPSDAVFKAFAVARIKLQQAGHKEFPVDLEDLDRLIKES